jgi:Uma2 family endonuclease
LGPELGLKGPIWRPDGEFRGRTCVLFLRQVATKTQITAEQYLRMTFEHDAEFVHGEIMERSMPDWIHSTLQYLILLRFAASTGDQLFPRPELRLKLAPDVFRIPDISVVTQPPDGIVPDRPPLVTIEILSKDDRHSNLMQKLEEYIAWGVPNIWVIDPATQRFSIYTELGLQNVSSFSLAGYPFQLAPADLFSQL